METIKVSVASLNQTAGDFKANIANIVKAAEIAHRDGALFLLTPELSLTGYGNEDNFSYMNLIDKALIKLDELAKALPQNIAVAVGLPYLYNGKLFNGIAVLLNGEIVGITFKKNLASNGIHYEQRWFTPWNQTDVFHHQVCINNREMNIPVGTPLYDINGFRMGIEICEDSWVAKRVASYYYDLGVDIIVNPSASHFAISKFETRKQLVCESSRTYAVNYLYSNLNGVDSGRAVYDGGCLIAGSGKIISQGPRFHHTPVEVTTSVLNNSCTRYNKAITSQRYSENQIDTGHCLIKLTIREDVTSGYLDKLNGYKQSRQTTSAWEQSDNIDHEEAVRAIALGLRDWSCKTRTNGYELSLSGGADSGLVASLVSLSVKIELDEFLFKGIDIRDSYFYKFISDKDGIALTGETIKAIETDIMSHYLETAYQPSANSGDVTKNAARKLAEFIGAKHHVFNVQKVIDAYLNELSTELGIEFNWKEHDIFLQNIQARSRSPMIWGATNLTNKLLLTTSNLSEASLGYATQDGDTSGVLAPISGVTKSRILKILNWLETSGIQLNHSRFHYQALHYINSQKPTAELRPEEQEDEKDLMPYALLDQILMLQLQKNLTPAEIFESIMMTGSEYDTDYLIESIIKYFTMFARNQWKRDRQAPSFHIEINSLDPKTDKRMPLLGNPYQEDLDFLRSLIGQN